MKFRLKNVLPNRFRNFERSPIEQARVDALKESIGVGGFHDHLPGRVVGDRIELVYGHHRIESMRQLFPDGEMEVEFEVVTYSDGKMIQMMTRENNEVYAAGIQQDIENVRLTVEALGAGQITREEFPPPSKLGRSARYAPGFRIGVPHSVTRAEFPYDAHALAKFLGQTKASTGQATPKLMLILDALEAVELGELSPVKLDKIEYLYAETIGLQAIVKDIKEKRGVDEAERDEIAIAERHGWRDKKQAELTAELAEEEQKLVAHTADFAAKSDAFNMAQDAFKEASTKAKKSKDQADIEEAEKSWELCQAIEKERDNAKFGQRYAEQGVKRIEAELKDIEDEKQAEADALKEEAEEADAVEAAVAAIDTDEDEDDTAIEADDVERESKADVAEKDDKADVAQRDEKADVAERDGESEEADPKVVQEFLRLIFENSCRTLDPLYKRDLADQPKLMAAYNQAKEKMDEWIGDYVIADFGN